MRVADFCACFALGVMLSVAGIQVWMWQWWVIVLLLFVCRETRHKIAD
jgi:hypothetical protein